MDQSQPIERETYMDQSRQDEMMTATLPAWMWRMVTYCVYSHIDYRQSVGSDDVADRYQDVLNALYEQLGVQAVGDLPIRSTS